jgi:hypothetical protein
MCSPLTLVVDAFDELVVLGALVQAAKSRDKVIGGAAPAAGVAPQHNGGFDLLREGLIPVGVGASRRRSGHSARMRFQ